MKNKTDKYFYWLLTIIFFAAGFLRLYNLSILPPHLTPDEASLGYNAYSLLKTGRDEYGEFLPLILKSFGDFKPGLYSYITIPSIFIFGLTEFSVRLPNALMGILAVYLLYKISCILFRDKYIGLISGFVLALSPWHIQFSRGAWEVNFSLTLTLLGIYFFLRSLDHNKLLILSSIFFGLTLIAYQGAKLSTAIVISLLGILFFKQLIKMPRKFIALSLFSFLILSFPIIMSLFTGKAGRLNVFSVFSYPRPESYLQNFLDQGNETKGELTYYLYHSESLNFLRGIMGRYFNHFSLRFLLFEGDWSNPRHTAPYHGVLLLTDILFFVIGIYAFTKRKINKETIFIIGWLLISPLPAVLSRDQVHAVRAYQMVIPLSIIIALGIHYFLNSFKFKKLVLIVILFVYFTSLVYYLDAYFIHVAKGQSKLWEYGYKQIVDVVTPIQGNYQKIKVQQSYAQPYIYFLFYQKYDPNKYQMSAKLKESEFGDVGQVLSLDNIEFAPIDWSVNRGEKGTLFVADPLRIPVGDSTNDKEFSLISEIKYLNGETAFRIIEVKE